MSSAWRCRITRGCSARSSPCCCSRSLLRRFARRARLSHEAWWKLHLLTYLALALSFSHQIATGASFAHHPVARLAWTTLWLSSAGVVLTYRVVLPVWRSAYHRLRVVRVVLESADVYSLVIKGRKLERLAVSGGQYFQWRFLARGLWTHTHPYSLSALPSPPYMRLTLRAVGEHSAAIARLTGTRIAVEGPYGSFTKHAIQGRGVALIGAGTGATPIRALLEDLPAGTDTVVLLRASSRDELLLADEIAALTGELTGRALALLGTRHEMALETELNTYVPDLPARDVFVSGPEPFTAAVRSLARGAGVPAARLRIEGYG
jgi:ferredoxin-NADP reductase